MYYNSNVLYHHGILGMKWGVRRYQNEDGTLTEAGKKRYGYNLNTNDTSRTNIAKIRYGEARRRYEYSKGNPSSDPKKTKELRRRVGDAKQNLTKIRRAVKGSELSSQGRNITGTKVSRMMITSGIMAVNRLSAAGINYLYDTGKLDHGKAIVMSQLNNIGGLSAMTIAAIKLSNDERNIRAYYNSQATGDFAKKRIGSTEYADRMKES